tara:strand:+ start:325 stop:510 length:186 start_codon:yes stop_codon:yes gene_type:complete
MDYLDNDSMDLSIEAEREVQRLSRRMSGGRVTISQRLAQAVAVGRLSMEEAIGRQLQRLSY